MLANKQDFNTAPELAMLLYENQFRKGPLDRRILFVLYEFTGRSGIL